MSCTVHVGHFYRDPDSGQIFEVTHVMRQMMRVLDHTAGREPRMLNRSLFERDCVQVSEDT